MFDFEFGNAEEDGYGHDVDGDGDTSLNTAK